MFCEQKNSFLQLLYSQVNPRLLNRCITRARKQKLEDPFDVSPGLNRLASHQPSLPTDTDFDPTKRILPFGRSGIPILKRDLQQPDVQVVLKTLSTLNDLLKNPEKAYEAIRLRVQDRLISVVPRDEQFVRERCCMSYQLLSKYADGKQAMVANPEIVNLFLHLIKDDKPEVRIKAAHCLERISSFWMTADALVEAGYIQPLMDRLGVDEPEVSAIHLNTLSNLMYGNGKYVGMEAGAFDLMVTLLDSLDLDVRKGALRCLMLMTSTDLGKQMAAKCNLLVTLAKILHEDESLHVDAASVLVFCTMLVQAKAASAKMKMIPTRLVRLCKNHLNPDLQLFCLKALTNISEHPDVRSLMKKKHLGRLKRIPVTSDLLRKHKKILLRVVTWDPSDLICTFGTDD
ncbi:uncharacterized protein LOC123322945 [Coccinella septempunctata]|uniref:uncharacterized protein LOC123322945 n=1 Tax=Coccinella septempunctata TaxID=41139 RepID=UPI001D0762F8|nr:uncharacterized protein LOC123322945 [Coccinella septempunctata]